VDQLTVLALLQDLQQRVSDVTKLEGPQGLRGEKGDTGEQGPQGRDGPRGLPGADGPRGYTGEKGEQGEDGAEGERGVGVESVSQAADGDLIFHLTDGTEEVVEFPMGLLGASEGQQHTTVVTGGGSASPTKYTLVLSTPYVVNEGLLIDGHNIFGINSGQDSQVFLPDDVPSEKVVVINNEMDNFTVTVSSAL
jgi:hypothetical protein